MDHMGEMQVDYEGGPEMEKAGGADTEPDNAEAAVQGLVDSISREQGGTENVTVDASEKGNGDGFDLNEDERVRSDPQLFDWSDQRRTDSADYDKPRWA
jgi:hypothetical protein